MFRVEVSELYSMGLRQPIRPAHVCPASGGRLILEQLRFLPRNLATAASILQSSIPLSAQFCSVTALSANDPFPLPYGFAFVPFSNYLYRTQYLPDRMYKNPRFQRKSNLDNNIPFSGPWSMYK